MDNYMVIGYAQTAAESAATITPTNYGYPELCFERYGGGVSATSTVNDSAMTSALAVATNRGGGILYFSSAGTYAFASSYSLPGSLIIQGTGSETVLSYSGTTAFLTIPSGGRNEIRDIELSGPGSGTTSIGLKIGSTTASPGLVMMRRVAINGFGVGMSVAGLLWGRFEMVEFGSLTGLSGTYSNGVGIQLQAVPTTTAINQVTFSDCVIASNANAGVQGLNTAADVSMNTIRWCNCTIRDNCQGTLTNPQFSMGYVIGFEITGLYLLYTYSGSAPVAIQSQYMYLGIIADFYIDNCSYGIYDSVGGKMGEVDIIDGIILGASTSTISAASEANVIVRNVDVSTASVALTGTGCSYLPLGSGLASWPATTDTFTPTLSATSGTPTYTTHTGGYSKVGNSVNFNLSIVTSALGSLTGPIQVNNLPIALENDHTIGAVFEIECIGITPSWQQ